MVFFVPLIPLTLVVVYFFVGNHLINRVKLDFAFGQKDLPDPLQQTKNYFYEKALPLLLSAFDTCSHHIRLDKLEIDLGSIRPEEFTTGFEKMFLHKWKEALEKNKETSIYPAGTKKIYGSRTLNFSDIIYYLKKGNWPWYVDPASFAEIKKTADEYLSDEKNYSLLYDSVEDDDYAAERFLIHFLTPSLKEGFLKSLFSRHPLLREAQFFFNKIRPEKLIRKQGIYYVFIRRLMTTPPLTSPGDAEHFFISDDGLSTGWNAGAGDTKQEIKAAIHRFFSNPDEKTWEKLIWRKSIQDSHSGVLQYGQTGAELNEKINILNSGLVLFHSYLPYVFKDLNWVNSQGFFTSQAAKQKAVFFLQYIINNKSRQPEHHLVLNKILCGWPLQMPLQKGVVFSAAEKKAAGELCDSLKEHWRAVNNTSLKGIVASFIERKGVIEKTGNDFLLQVEKKTIDILMESLPFGIQTIKLPWNEYFIHTEWAY